jgi:RNA polymerase sigma factor (sigma-70 family)
LVGPHLNRLSHFVRHVIRYSEATGEISRGEVSVADVVDTSLVRAYREFLEGLPQGDIGNWLTRNAIDVLDVEVKQLTFDHERKVHIEEDVPETPPKEEVSSLGEEIMDFYQPDEDLKVEDLVPDSEAATPEEATETQELRRFVRAALAEMPREWRRVLLLRDVEGRAISDVARIIGKSEKDIEHQLEQARVKLKNTLTAYGYGARKAA